MVIQLDVLNMHFHDKVAQSPLRGTYNGVAAELYYYALTPANRNSFLNERIDHFRSLEHSCISRFFGYEESSNHQEIVYAFEPSKYQIHAFSSGFYGVQTLMKQLLRGLFHIHSVGFVHKSLHVDRSYILNQGPNMLVSAKISLNECVKLTSSEAENHTKDSNIADLADFFARFFCGGVTRANATLRVVNHIPRFILYGNTYKLYEEEVKDFITSLRISPSLELWNHPVFWTSEKRMFFLQSVYEFCCCSPHHSARSAIYNLDFGANISNFPRCLKLDLSEVGFQVHNTFGLLTCMRHMSAHRFSKIGMPNEYAFSSQIVWESYDTVHIRGFDKMMSRYVPKFLISVYNVVKTSVGPVCPVGPVGRVGPPRPCHPLFHFLSLSYKP